MHIVWIGAGYVGGPSAAVMARHCREHTFAVVDIDAARIAMWQRAGDAKCLDADLPVHETGLVAALQSVLDLACDTIRDRDRDTNDGVYNLTFSTEIDEHLARADLVFVAVATPTKTRGAGAGRAHDLSQWEAAARRVAAQNTRGATIVIKSTVPIGTAAALERIVGGAHAVVVNPEFLAEGTAVHNLEAPDRVIVGARSAAAADAVAALYRHWVAPERVLVMGAESAELSKLAANAFLAQRISSANAVAQMCEERGADARDVMRAIGADPRIGAAFLRPSVGFGGSCFRKDVASLAYLYDVEQLGVAARYWQGVLEVNDEQTRRFVARVLRVMFNTVAGKRIAVLGCAFKAGTGDTRDSPALAVCAALSEEGARLAVYDPAVPAAAVAAAVPGAEVCAGAAAALSGAHALVALTAWPEFASLDAAAAAGSMMRPLLAFDGAGVLDAAALGAAGFEVHAIGRR